MEDSHSSGHEADSKRGESHLAKVQGEYISSDVTCGQPAGISAMKVFNALSRGLGTCIDCPGRKSDGRTGGCCSGVCSHEVPASCGIHVKQLLHLEGFLLRVSGLLTVSKLRY